MLETNLKQVTCVRSFVSTSGSRNVALKKRKKGKKKKKLEERMILLLKLFVLNLRKKCVRCNI